MKQSYGKMKIKKGCILYHTSDKKFIYKDNNVKPMLFCIFHPSEWDFTNKYVHFIRLKKDISLLFMINNIIKARIFSSLNLFTTHPSLNLAKKYNNNLLCYVTKLKEDKLDGWFSSIENKMSVEVALINDNNIFEIIKTEKLERNWNNGNYNRLKNWGIKYNICSIQNPVILRLNIRYKKMLKKYKKYEIESKYLKEYIFQVILDNAKIYYHDGELEKIHWKC
jgi:hypothetical protein